jgi:DNA-binding transcriptional MerR regulator
LTVWSNNSRIAFERECPSDPFEDPTLTASDAPEGANIVFLDDVPADEALTAATFTAQELAAEFGVSLQMIRHFEENRLLRRSGSEGQRGYSQRDRFTLEQIVRARRFGLSLVEIAEFLTGTDGPFQAPILWMPAERCRARIGSLKQQRDEIDAAIRDLESLMRRAKP